MREINLHDLDETMTKFSSLFVGFALLLLVLGAAGLAQAENPDKLYRQGRYKEAMTGYEQRDLDHPRDLSYRFNRGCAAYQLKDYQTAQAAFTSVYTRAQDPDLRFKAAYNLGNTGFAAGDFGAAVDYYKEALRLNPKSAEARHNLELSLRKREEAKKPADQNKDQDKTGQPNQGQQCKNPQGKKGSDGKQDRQPKNGKDQPDKPGEPQPRDQKGDNGEPQPESAGRQAHEEPQDLSGELTAGAPGQSAKSQEGREAESPAKAVERNKAEALLDNIQEDRSRFLRLQVPENRRGGPKSGKYW